MVYLKYQKAVASAAAQVDALAAGVLVGEGFTALMPTKDNWRYS